MKTNPRTIKWLVLLALVTFNLQPSTLLAQGTAFSYQGRLNDGGNAANGIYDLRFAIYDAGSGGNVVAGPLTNSASTVSNGLFTVTIDFGAGIFSGSARWLEMGARTNGAASFTTLTPRQALTPAPYAIYAPNAGTAETVTTLTNGQAVTSFNGVTDQVRLLPGTNIAISVASNTFTISAALNYFDPCTNECYWKTHGNYNTDPAWGNFLGTIDNHILEFRVNNQAVLHLIPGSCSAGGDGFYMSPNADHCIIAWGQNNSIGDHVMWGTISGGATNTIQNGACQVTIGGGSFNMIEGNVTNSTIGGGHNNKIQCNSFDSTIGGGHDNTIKNWSFSATIGGGGDNTIECSYQGAIGGGEGNSIGLLSYEATIAGGYLNAIQSGGAQSCIVGGRGNTIQSNADVCAIGGGLSNIISTGDWANTIGGGAGNTIEASTYVNTIGGGNNNTIGDQNWANTIGGGDGNVIQANADHVFIGGGGGNDVSAPYGFLGGGGGNTIESVSPYSIIVGGWGNSVQSNSQYSVIGGGLFNTIQFNTPFSFLGGGLGNSIFLSDGENGYNGYAFLGGGQGNMIQFDGDWAFLGGGLNNMIRDVADYTFLGGGQSNLIDGYDYSVLVGGCGNMIQAGSAFVGGGMLNTNQAFGAFVGGGENNTIQDEADDSIICGGEMNTVLSGAACSTISGGKGNTIGFGQWGEWIAESNCVIYVFGQNVIGGGAVNCITNATCSTISGGYKNTVCTNFATIPGGLEAVATNFAQLAYSGGMFAKPGDSQYSLYVLRGLTSSNNLTCYLHLDGVSLEIALAGERSCSFTARFVGRDSASPPNTCAFNIRGGAKNVNGTVTVNTLPVETLMNDFVNSFGGSASAAIVGSSYGALRVQVVDNSSWNSPIRWTATVETAEVAW